MDQRSASRSPSRSPIDEEKKENGVNDIVNNNGVATNNTTEKGSSASTESNKSNDTAMKESENNNNNNNNNNNSSNNNNNNNDRSSRSPSRGRRGDSKDRSKSRDRSRNRNNSRSRDRDNGRDRSRNRNNSRSRSRSGSRKRKSVDFSLLAERRVYVGRISPKTTRETLEIPFQKYGKVLSCDVKNGYAFVEFDNDKSARDAIEEMRDVVVDGEKILVEKSHSGKKHPDECFICRGRGHWARSCPKGNGR